VYFHYVIDNTTECDANVVPLTEMPTDLGSIPTTPNYVFISPSLCKDGHDSPCITQSPGRLAQADTFLQTWIPLITASPAFKQDGLLIITFDEQSATAPHAAARSRVRGTRRTASSREVRGPAAAYRGRRRRLPTPTAPPDSRLAPKPRSFRPAASAESRKGGTMITYTDSQAGTTTLTAWQVVKGARPGKGRARRFPGPAGPPLHATGCTIRKRLGSLTHVDTVGVDRLAFNGRLGGHALAPGSYQLQATPKLGTLSGKTETATFEVL
jgi:hypothetical protein